MNDCIFDTEEDGKLVCLTIDNYEKALVMLAKNPHYTRARNVFSGPTRKYIGSSAYWCEELRVYLSRKYSDKPRYSVIIKYLVRAIDFENRTHLNKDREAVIEYLETIGPYEFIAMLKNWGENYSLLETLAHLTREGSCHYAFASKFCHIVSLNLLKEGRYKDQYCVYDKTIRTALPLYAKKYLSRNMTETNYRNYYLFAGDIEEITNKIGFSKMAFCTLVKLYHGK